MRTLIVLLVLATTALGHAGSWQAVRYGSDETAPGTYGIVTGNPAKMRVIAHAVVTHTDLACISNPLAADQDGAGSDADTVWYELTFVGAANAKNHAWSIETNIHGTAQAEATVNLQGTAIVEALHLIKVSGNHKNMGAGQLGAADTADVKYSLKAPSEFGISLESSCLEIGVDNFTTKVPKKTTGTGTKCRIRIDTDVQARASASTRIGIACATAYGELRVDLKMIGSCTFEGIPVRDTFKIGSGGRREIEASKTTPPSGGIVTKREVPTDTPEEDLPEPELLDEEEEDDEDPLPPSTGGEDSTTV
ncbi:MAG: hypothetical protein ABFS86_06295 [Planctomycetota bacterium]